jgi:hypothetical protein
MRRDFFCLRNSFFKIEMIFPDPAYSFLSNRIQIHKTGFGLLTCGDGGDILAVELVTAVHAVRRSVALPRAEHAVTARTPELPVLTKKTACCRRSTRYSGRVNQKTRKEKNFPDWIFKRIKSEPIFSVLSPSSNVSVSFYFSDSFYEEKVK